VIKVTYENKARVNRIVNLDTGSQKVYAINQSSEYLVDTSKLSCTLSHDDYVEGYVQDNYFIAERIVTFEEMFG
jgi:hypothetical protein